MSTRFRLLAAIAALIVMAAAVGVVSAGWFRGPPVADADLAAGVVVDQHVFDNGASWRSYEAAMDRVDEDVAVCMQQAGYDYSAPERTGDERGEAAFGHRPGSDLDFARNWGFGFTTVQDFVPTRPDGAPAVDRVGERSDGFERALHGSEVGFGGGCHMAAMSTIRANGDRYFELVDRVELAKARFTTHPDVVEHYADWSACMARRGHDVTSPAAAAASITRAVRAAVEDDRDYVVEDEIRPREIEVATDTVECGGPARNLLDDELVDTWVDVARGAGL